MLRGATITARQTATGLTRTEITNDNGEHSIPQLPVGPYLVTVEQPGFKKTERTGIELRVDDRLRIDFSLSVGQFKETVTVQETTPLVATGNRIPVGRISQVGQNVVNLYPDPNTPGTSASNGLYTSSPTRVDDFNQFCR